MTAEDEARSAEANEFTEPPEGAVCAGTLDLECLGPDFKRIELGIHKETGQVSIKAVGWDNSYELLGFIHTWCHPEQIVGNLNAAAQQEGP